MSRLEGQTVIVTGAGSGIGRATSVLLASEGAKVACLDVVGPAGDETASLVCEAGGQGRAYQCDVSDAISVSRALSGSVSDMGRPTGLCNVAGIGKFAHTTEMPVEEWDRIIDVNLKGTFLACREALPHLLESGGSIVNFASSAGLTGQPYSAAYCASKGGVVMLTKALALEYVERGVRVNAVAPGGIETPLLGSFGFPEGSSTRLFARIMSPMGFGKPEEVAGVVAFLLSSETRYMTGSVVSIDGGITI